MKARHRTWIILALTFAVLGGCGKGKPPQDQSPAPETGAASVAPGTTAAAVPPSAADPRLKDPDYLRTLPPSAEVEMALARALLDRGEADSALAHARRATGMEPQNAATWNYLGITLGRLDRLPEAKQALQKALDLDSVNDKTHINMGNILLRQGKLDEAKSEYLIATTIDSTNATVWINLAMVYEREKKLNKAILAYDSAISHAPDDAEPWERLGNLYYNRKLYRVARDSWEEALKRDPSRTRLREKVEKLKAYADSTKTR